MKLLQLLLLTIVITSSSHSTAGELINVTRADTKDITQLYFTFDTTPEFSVTSSQKRVDLLFVDSDISASLNILDADDRIVKFLSRVNESNELTVSLFFRYIPQNYKFTRSNDGKLVFEVLVGNQFSKSYQNLANKLKGLTVLNRPSFDLSNPSISSPYAKDWMSFFSEYESPIDIEVPVQFTAPPFPIIRLLPPGKEKNLHFLTAEMFNMAATNQWDSLASLITKLILTEPDIEQKKILALTYGDVLFRDGDFEGAFKQLYLLHEKYPEELIGSFSKYLLLVLRATYEDPHIADYEYRILEEQISKGNPLAPYLLLSQIETALATSQLIRMNQLLLRDDIGFPPVIAEIRQIRQADYWFAIDQHVKAYASYILLAKSQILTTLPYSLNGYCTTLYTQKQYRESAACYKQLARLDSLSDYLGVINYREKMAELKFEKSSTLIGDFAEIENTFTHSEGGVRATLKKNDLILLQNKNWARQALANYGEVAETFPLRAISEEATFKQAIVYSLLGQNDQSIVILQQLLRNFKNGDTTISAQALLIDILPLEIKRLVDEKNYIKALVLAKQNKDLFQNNWINSKHLVDIAKAYHNIGIYDEAHKLYLYLIEIVPIEQKEKFYLPMISATFLQGNYNLVDNYAAQYTYNYPDGKFSPDILFIRLKALVADERLEDALVLLPSPLPDDIDIFRFTTSLYYLTDNYKECVRVVEKLQLLDAPLSPEEKIMFGESLINTDKFQKAEKIFLEIKEDNPFYDQSLYRLAEIERKRGNEKNALRLFTKIVEKGSSSRWKQYAQKELKFADAAARM